MPKFIPGLQLGEQFYSDAVAPLLAEAFPELKYAAALIGHGSEILGYDTQISTDHHWGPRLLIFLAAADCAEYAAKIRDLLAEKLPYRFLGYPTNYGAPDEIGVQLLQEINNGPVNHRVEITTAGEYFAQTLGYSPHKLLSAENWLFVPQQELLSLTAGAVYRDDHGELTALREKLSYYPEDIRLYLMACQWERISQEEAFPGRCGDCNDETGSRLIAARLAEHLMKLCFYLERKYIPYSKWFGTAFSRLAIAPVMLPQLNELLAAADWRSRERALAAVYHTVLNRHNAQGITAPLETAVSNYYGRPYLVIHADVIAAKIRAAITDEQLRNRNFSGSVDQFLAEPHKYREVIKLVSMR